MISLFLQEFLQLLPDIHFSRPISALTGYFSSEKKGNEVCMAIDLKNK
jgi:hypothetical protein